MLGYLLPTPADKARAEGKPRVVDLNDAPSTGRRAGVLQEEWGKREGTSAVVFAGGLPCPHPNRTEGVRKRPKKGFLTMPRRF